MSAFDDWAERAAALRDELVVAGNLTSPEWVSALLAVPRHEFVPEFYERRLGGGWELLSGESPDTSARWRAAMYTNRSLVTQIGEVPDGGRDRTGPTSSSSAPGLMLRMVEALDVSEGHRVLEIGTGTGYNAALLCRRLGADNVCSVDVDAGLVDLARERLAALGYQPHLAAVDGAAGLAEHAPYDRILATCAVSRVPWEWAEQTVPGGRVLVDLKIHAAVGNLVVLDRRDDRLEGHFDPGRATFMHIRSPRMRLGRTALVERARDIADRRTTTERVERVWENGPLWFLVHLSEPGRVEFGYAMDPETGRPGALFLVARDGAWCEVSAGPDGTRMVLEGGPRRLWAAIERAAALWREQGRPGWDRFGLTAFSADEQVAWLDQPDGRHRWAIPGPCCSPTVEGESHEDPSWRPTAGVGHHGRTAAARSPVQRDELPVDEAAGLA